MKLEILGEYYTFDLKVDDKSGILSLESGQYVLTDGQANELTRFRCGDQVDAIARAVKFLRTLSTLTRLKTTTHL